MQSSHVIFKSFQTCVSEYMQEWDVSISILIVILDVISKNIFLGNILHFFDKKGKTSMHVIYIAYLETFHIETNIKKCWKTTLYTTLLTGLLIFRVSLNINLERSRKITIGSVAGSLIKKIFVYSKIMGMFWS